MALMSVEEWRKQKAQQGTTSSSAPSASSSGTAKTSDGASRLMSVAEWRAERATKSAQGWADAANALLKDTQNYFGSWRSKDDDGYNSLAERSTSLLAQADSWRKQYAGNDEALSYIDEVVSALSKARQSSKDYFDFYGQWDSQDSYNKWMQYSTPEGRQEQYEKNQARLEELKQQRRSTVSYQPASSAYLTGEIPYYGSPLSATHQGEQITSLTTDIDREIAQIEKEMRMYERGETDEAGNYYGNKVADDYGKYLQDTKFLEASQNRAFQNGDRAALSAYDAEQSQGSMALSNGGYIDEDGNIRDAYGNVAQDTFEAPVQDKLGLFLSASDEDIGEAYTILGAVQGSYPTTWASILQEGDVKRWRHLKDDELQIYYGLLNTEGQESAYRYLDAMEVELGRREMQQVKAYIDETSGLEQVMLNVASVPLNMIGGIAATVDNVGRLVTGKDLNPYSRAQSLLSSGNYIRSNTAQEIDAATGNKEIPGLGFSWGDAYQAGMSMVDSLVGAKIGGKAYQAVMSMGAASSEMARLYSQGASMEQMVLGSVAAGAAEWVFEKYSIENLIDMKSPDTLGQFLKNAFIQGGIEMSEEAATEFANILTNGLIMQSESDWAKALEENGGDYGKALKEMAIRIANAGLSGFLSGMGSGSIQQGMQYGAQQQENKKIGSYISGADSTDALVALALDMASGESGKAQKNLQNQSQRIVDDNFLTKGGKNKAIGRLYNTVNTVVTEQNISEISTALQEKGFSKKDATAIAGAVAVQASGLELTDKQQKVLEKFGSNEDVQGVLSEILDNEESGINQRAKSVAQFEFGAMRNHIISSIEKELPGQEKATASDNVDAQTENSAEGSYEVSAEGKTILKSTGKIVNIQEVADIQDGKMTLRLDDGSTVDASEVSYASKDEALIYETVAQMGASVKAANILVKGFQSAEGMNASAYAHGIEEAFRYGMHNDKRGLANSVFASKLNAGQQEYVYRQGQKAAGKQVAKEQATVLKNRAAAEAATAGKVSTRSYQAVLEDGITEESLNESQKVSYHLAGQVAEAAKVNIRVYAGKTGEWGYYKPSTDEIYLNLNATNKSRKSMMAFTLGHELVHRAKKGSPAKYKAFANFLMEEYGKNGASLDAMIAEQMDAAKEHDIEMTPDEAFEEVVCDACQRMLVDTDAGKKLAEFGAQSKENKSFLDNLKQWIEEFLDKLRTIFAGVDSDSLAAKEFNKFDAAVKQILADMYVDMTIDAGNNLSTIQNAFGKGTVVKTNEHGEFTMASSQDGSERLFNLTTWNNGGRETLEATLLREGYTEDEVKAALTIMDEKQRLVQSIANELNDNGKLAFPEQGRINEATLTTDLKDGHSVLSALVSNGDYPVNIDLLMVCKKRKAYQRVINRLCETGMIQQATVDALAIAEINKILGKYGFETACLGCFVESRRLRIQEWAQTICKEWNAEVKKRNPNAKAFGFGKGEATLTPEEVMKIIGELESGGAKNDKGNLNLGQGSAVKRMGVLLDKVPSLRRTLSIEDLITPDGLSSLRSFDSNLFSMVKSRYGSNSPKFVQEFNPYNHELAMYGKVPSEYKSLREYLYAIGGARMQSFSDFIVENWFDYCQIVADLAARKLPMHTYTKEIALAKLFGLTGIKINMSLIPDIDRSLGKEFAGLTRNEKGELELIWADKDRFKKTGGKSYMQSINFADAMALQEDPRYSANVGTIAVGVSDRHIEMMLADPRIRMVIPYHSSGMNPIFADLMGTSYYKDYTNFQNTTVKQLYNSKGQPVSVKLEKAQNDKLVSGFQFNTVLQDLGDARAAAQAYKDWCADASKHTITIKGETYTAELTPKFDDFSGHENYYKLLEDFNTYDCISEQAAPQGDVQQIYPEDFDDILKAELKAQEGHRQKQEANQAFDKAMDEIEGYLKNHTKADTVHYAQQHGIKLSKKDSKLDAADKAKLKKLQDEGSSFKLPKKPYSYENLISKPDMVVTTVGGTVPKNRADVAQVAKQNATKVGKFDPKTGSVSVHVEDIDTDVILSTKGLRHGLRRTQDPLNVPNYIVTVKAGEILKNSIRINEITPSDDNAKSSYVLMGAAKDANGTYVVRFVVNHFDNNVTAMDVLYAINAKKELAATKSPRLTAEPLSVTSSTISIAELLDLVNQYFPDILPEEVLKHYGYDSRPEGELGEDALYKLPVGEDTSPRALLVNAFEGVAQNEIERNKIQEYKSKIELINAEERKLSELREQIKELSFAKGPKETQKIRDLQFEAMQASNRINTYDKQLLRLEASKPLQAVVDREKEMARKRAEQKGKEALEAYREKAANTQRELLKRYEDSRKKGIDSRQRTAMRHKIKDVVNDLNQYLLKGTKDRHVPIGLQKAVAEALNAVNMDTIGAEERIAKLQKDLMKAKTPEAIQEISKKIEHIREMGDRMDERLKKLKEAYDEFINSDDPLIANSHDDGMSAHMMKLIVRVGDTPLREMTVDQLQDVYDVYKVVLATIRNANKAFKDNKNREISTIASQVMAEIDNLGVKKGKSIIGFDWVNKFGWDNLKPVYAMEHIGSRGLIEAFNNVRAGEDTWAKDIVEAREFYLERFKKYGYDSWDFEKKYKFTSTTGKDFELTLDQIMSLYAYSKRDQAEDHLRYGGIVFDPKTEVVEKTKSGIKVKYNVANATAYNISADTLAEIISILKDEQTDFVDEMQAYLSDVMGAKGNEVSLAMYDVKLFREKHYFPLKSAPQYMAKAKEQAMGEVKIKNSGFSKETKPHAKNPIVLSSFMDVWTNHVNEMSMYHAFVLPMEDFYRIYNYTTPSKNENMPTEGVTAYIENAYGSGATGYIEQMLKDLNGGARSDSRAGILNWFMGKFKKGAVFASASVVIQQPSAIARAAALVDTKYFIGPKVDAKRHKLLWDEVKQYAPVAIIKEMGYFDTNMGKSTQDFITAKEHDGWFELIGRLDVKGLAKNTKDFVVDSDYRDEVLSWAPGYADELAWCGIWEAVKRETKAKNPGMDVKSEAFLEKAGERFTEVIVKTQVYDSVLARSANMRSKDTGMKMATAFMAEPTTSINMIGDALLKGKRGGAESRRYCRKTIGAVVASVILNSFLVAFVQAARDDDEDESIAEKYIGSFTAEVLDGLNPLTYIPFIKDIVSIVQGYDVERSDMSVISDIVNAVRKLSSDKVSGWKKVEDFVGSICQVFGLPVKNIMRDVRAAYQAFDTIVNGEKTTARGIKYAVKEAITGKSTSNPEQLYKSRLAGDAAHTARVEARYAKGAEDAEEAAKSANAAVRQAIKNDFLDGKIDSSTAMDRMVGYAGMTNDEAYWLMDAWKYRKTMGTDEGYSKFTAFFDAVKTGKNLKAVIKNYIDNGVPESDLTGAITDNFKDKYVEMSAAERAGIKGYLINAFEQCGMLRVDAEKKLADWDFEAKHGFDYEDRGKAYRNREITREQLKEALMTYGGKTEEEAEQYIAQQDFHVATGFAYSDREKAYNAGYLSADILRMALINISGKTEEEADILIEAHEWIKAHGRDDLYASQVQHYIKNLEDKSSKEDLGYSIEDTGMDIDVYLDAYSYVYDIQGDGSAYSKIDKAFPYIDSLNLTPEQKTALAVACGWGLKTVKKKKLW